jgi:hypothetical protein
VLDGTVELDGDMMAVGADLNLYRGAYDLEFDGYYGMTDYDVSARVDDPLTAGAQLVDLLSDGEVSDDQLFVRGRVAYRVGLAHIWHGLAIGNRSVESDLAGDDLVTGEATTGAAEFDENFFTPSTGVKFPLGCQECSTRVNLFAGASYEMNEGEFELRSTVDGELVAASGVDDSFGDAAYRLGLEVRGERYVFELLWDSESGTSCGSPSPFPGSGGGQGCHEGVDNDELTGAFSFRF